MATKKYFLIISLLISLGFAGVAAPAAPSIVTINGSTKYEQSRVLRLVHSLNYSKQPMPQYWAITILDEANWNDAISKYKLNTYSAYTDLFQRHTYLNEDYLITADDPKVSWTLAHESGHLSCMCQSEQKANEIAAVITGRSSGE